MIDKIRFIEKVRSNINQYGHHITIVNGGGLPRYAYTIGLMKTLGIELVFAGGIHFLKDELYHIINTVAESLKTEQDTEKIKLNIDGLGSFTISNVKSSWSKSLMLGAFDFFELNELKAFQIRPDSRHSTLDIPDMSKEIDLESESIWQWHGKEWPYEIPQNSTEITDLSA